MEVYMLYCGYWSWMNHRLPANYVSLINQWNICSGCGLKHMNCSGFLYKNFHYTGCVNTSIISWTHVIITKTHTYFYIYNPVHQLYGWSFMEGAKDVQQSPQCFTFDLQKEYTS